MVRPRKGTLRQLSKMVAVEFWSVNTNVAPVASISKSERSASRIFLPPNGSMVYVPAGITTRLATAFQVASMPF